MKNFDFEILQKPSIIGACFGIAALVAASSFVYLHNQEPAAIPTAIPQFKSVSVSNIPKIPETKVYSEVLTVDQRLQRDKQAYDDAATLMTSSKPYDKQRAFLEFVELANSGYISAKRVVGNAHLKGVGTIRDYDKAYEWLASAASGNDAAAQHLLGKIFEEGLGKQINFQTSLKWYILAADQNYSKSQVAAGRLIMNGKGTALNYVIAERWLKAAAVNGEVEAVKLLKELKRQLARLEHEAALRKKRLEATKN